MLPHTLLQTLHRPDLPDRGRGLACRRPAVLLHQLQAQLLRLQLVDDPLSPPQLDLLARTELSAQSLHSILNHFRVILILVKSQSVTTPSVFTLALKGDGADRLGQLPEQGLVWN